MKPDCPNCQSGSCEHISDTPIFYVTDKEWEQLQKALQEPPEPNENLRKLLGGKDEQKS